MPVFAREARQVLVKLLVVWQHGRSWCFLPVVLAIHGVNHFRSVDGSEDHCVVGQCPRARFGMMWCTPRRVGREQNLYTFLSLQPLDGYGIWDLRKRVEESPTCRPRVTAFAANDVAQVRYTIEVHLSCVLHFARASDPTHALVVTLAASLVLGVMRRTATVTTHAIVLC